MVAEGDTAPEFTAPLARPDGEITEQSFDDILADGPVILAFFPGAFTRVCTSEMEEFRDRHDDIEATGAALYGVSIDTPFALQEFADQLNLTFPLISDTEKEIIDAYGVTTGFNALGVSALANRAVFVIDETGTITYAWIANDPTNEPEYPAVEAAAADV